MDHNYLTFVNYVVESVLNKCKTGDIVERFILVLAPLTFKSLLNQNPYDTTVMWGGLDIISGNPLLQGYAFGVNEGEVIPYSFVKIDLTQLVRSKEGDE